MGVSRFVKTGLNPFTREPLEFFDVGQMIPAPGCGNGIGLEPLAGHSGHSHFGGDALLAPGAQWPCGPNGPLTLLLALDFGEIDAVAAGVDDLPASGILNVFYDTTGADWSLSTTGPQHWRLIFETGQVVASPPPTKSSPAVPFRANIDGTQRDGHPRHQLAGEPKWIQVDQRPWLHFISGHYRADSATLEALRCAGLPEDALVTSDHKALLSAARALDAALVDPAIFKPGVTRWRHLLQIDSDESLSFCWGDVGTLYVLIPDEALSARRFDDAWICMQCY